MVVEPDKGVEEGVWGGWSTGGLGRGASGKIAQRRAWKGGVWGGKRRRLLSIRSLKSQGPESPRQPQRTFMAVGLDT